MRKYELGLIVGLVILFLLFMAMAAQAIEVVENPDGTATITLTKEEVNQCKEQNGCTVATKDLEDVHEKAMKFVEEYLKGKPL